MNALSMGALHNVQIQLAVASRILSSAGHDDFNQGQVSARIPGSQTFWIKRAFAGFDSAEPADMISCAVDDLATVPTDAPPELPLHQAIYAARPNVGAIVHSHPVNATIFGATELDVVPISHEGAFFAEQIPRFTESSHTILNIEMGKRVAETMGNAPAIFLCNHGIVVAAKTIRQCTVLALMLERACRIQLIASASNVSCRVSSSADVSKKKSYIYSDVALKSYWDHAAAAARRQFPELLAWSAK